MVKTMREMGLCAWRQYWLLAAGEIDEENRYDERGCERNEGGHAQGSVGVKQWAWKEKCGKKKKEWVSGVLRVVIWVQWV